MDLQIAGKVALVTGASKGIGLAIAQGLAAEGCRVMMSARGETALQKAVEEIRLHGGEAFAFAADVRAPQEIAALFAHTRQLLADPAIVVVNAGGPAAGRADSLAESAFADAYELTLMSAVRLARAALPAMQAQRWGRIINVTSLSIKQPVANLALSNTFRTAVTGFAKTLSAEVAASGITINNVAPGYTATERLEELFANEAAKTALVDTIPAKRLASPHEVAAAAVFLASQQAAYITGQTVVVDGGMVGATY
jgi:3-oxoacyl-[acyl-carrier protein] reductase